MTQQEFEPTLNPNLFTVRKWIVRTKAHLLDEFDTAKEAHAFAGPNEIIEEWVRCSSYVVPEREL